MATSPERSGSTDPQINCPVPSCTYTHQSVPGILSHVGNGHEDGWDTAELSPHELHFNATLRDPGAVERAASVKAWFEDEGLPVEKFVFYEHQGYGTIQAATDARLGASAYMKFRDLALETDGVTFAGDRAWCASGLPGSLPSPSHADLKAYLRVSS